MTAISYPPSTQPVKPVDPFTSRILRALDGAAKKVNCEFFVAGATARDLVLVNAFGLSEGRATRDIDFGIAVESWSQFQELHRALIAAGEFEPAPKCLHRLLSRPSGIPVEIVPFGGIASAGKTIAWPPDQAIVMNVAGFEDALRSSLRLRVADDLLVRVASIPGLAVLKFLAWKDRRRVGNKDALDLFRLLHHYAAAGNEDRLYDAELPLLESAGFDMEVAGAELLGRDAARVCRLETRRQITAILTSEELTCELAQQMDGSPFYDSTLMEHRSTLIGRFRKGFLNGD